MHIKSLCAVAAFSAICSAASSITSLNAAQSSRILSAWSVFDATIIFNSKVASLVQAVATAVPSSDIASTAVATKTSSIDLVSYLNNPPKETLPSWISDLPKSLASPYAALITSVESELVRLGHEAATGKVAETKATTGKTTLASSASSLLPVATGSTAASSTSGSSSSAAAAAASSTATGGAALATGNGFVLVAGVAIGAVGAAAFML